MKYLLFSQYVLTGYFKSLSLYTYDLLEMYREMLYLGTHNIPQDIIM